MSLTNGSERGKVDTPIRENVKPSAGTPDEKSWPDWFFMIAMVAIAALISPLTTAFFLGGFYELVCGMLSASFK